LHFLKLYFVHHLIHFNLSYQKRFIPTVLLVNFTLVPFGVSNNKMFEDYLCGRLTSIVSLLRISFLIRTETQPFYCCYCLKFLDFHISHQLSLKWVFLYDKLALWDSWIYVLLMMSNKSFNLTFFGSKFYHQHSQPRFILNYTKNYEFLWMFIY
jgi:hypothetical protein